MSRQEVLHDRKRNNLGETAVKRIEGAFLSRRLELINRAGKKIIAYLDIPQDGHSPLGVVLIPPAYGEVKENNLSISAYFVLNGFQGLRFDWTDHVGESKGDIFSSTLSGMKDDLFGLIDHVEQRFPSMRIGLLATSLAARVALKVTACDSRLDFLVLFAPAVNLQHTLNMVYREDLVGNYSRGKRYGTLDVLGFSIDADNFLGDAVKGSFSDLLSAMEDAGKIKVPTLFFVGERDSWVEIGDVRSVFQVIRTRQKGFFPIPKALHRLPENPAVIRDALKQAVSFIGSHISGRELDADNVREPKLEEVHIRETYEKARLKELYDYSKAEEREFWKKYLSNFQYIINIHDYWNLLELIYGLLGGAWPGQRILDAGCGNGNYGLFLLSKQMYKAHQDSQHLTVPPVTYFGVDFVEDALSKASCKIKELQDEFRKKMGLAFQKSGFMEARFILADLEAGTPFPDNFFDQICCNLVVSYLEEPRKALRELYRVLRPAGKIVISSLKPNVDLSEVYRNFISVAENDSEIEEARKLLSNSGMIKLKEVRGIYRFYTEKELKRMAREVGLTRPKAFHSFGDQANVVVAHKVP